LILSADADAKAWLQPTKKKGWERETEKKK